MHLLKHPLQRARKETFWALKGIEFDIKRGDVVGIIGRNGAGKSTLLKILSRITAPTTGRIDLYGRVGSLLEVGTGFHPELTGRENIYLNGTILGMKKREIAREFDAIVDFAGVEPFIDTPVKRFSSGMYVRLAFAVAAHLNSEILIVDEVLAVGDGPFQKKCMGKMHDVAGQGRTVLFVSHNMAAVSVLCSHIIALKEGRVWAIGSEDVIHAYREALADTPDVDLKHRGDLGATKRFWFTDVWFADPHGNPVTIAITGQELAICLKYEGRVSERRPDIAFTIYDSLGHPVAYFDTACSLRSGDHGTSLPCEVIRCLIPKLPLMPGEYKFNVLIHNRGEYEDHVISAARLTVEQGDFYGTGKLPPPGYAPVLVEHSWAFEVPGHEALVSKRHLPGSAV